ncbi:hypothetical protein [Xanthobacter sp. KR7-65]|uniref:hypothetical protein n=1 Tax=Xanthobacter sp. KR7-65 TaxID=3156612 RepID=UPI0032B53B39
MRPTLVAGLAAAMAAALATSPAWADKAAADRCAAKLPTEARSIYVASAPHLVPGADGRAVVTEQTRTLVLSGKVSHLTAAESAQAAANCLIMR